MLGIDLFEEKDAAGGQPVVGEAEGEESLLAVSSCINPVGTVGALTPPGDIHLVVNPGPGMAISLHIYGADVRKLGTSIRRRYNLPIYEAEPARIAS